MRATPSQAHVRIFRAVEGAVINAAHGHPHWRITENMARSIAKRATGTLTAAWPDVLAARSMPSDQAGGRATTNHWPPSYRARRFAVGERRWDLRRRSPLPGLWKRIAIMVGEAKRADQADRAAVLIEILRMIAEMQRDPQETQRNAIP